MASQDQSTSMATASVVITSADLIDSHMMSTPGGSNHSPPTKSSSGSNVKSSTLNRRQHAAQRARILALSKQLTTRLQYATFKVEHGWSEQSLSEVENLYYRHCKAATATTSSGPNLSPSALRKTNIPSTPNKLNNSRSSVPVSSGPNPSKQYSSGGQDTDVFGGLMTPPASGNNFPHHSEMESFSGGNPSFSSGSLARQRSPTAGLEGKGGSSGTAANKGKSYADFWSKIGTAGAGQANDRQMTN